MSTKTDNKTSVKSPFNTYYVYRNFPHNGVPYEQGDTIEMTNRQAKFLTLNGFVGKTKTPPKPSKEPAPAKTANA